MLCVFLLLGGCAKEQEAAVQPPEFPLDEQTVFDAFEDAGFSVILSEEDTEAQPDRVRVTLRDPERTYAEGGGHILVASVLTANTEQGRAMTLSYWGDEETAPAANLDDWKKQLGLAETFYGLKSACCMGAVREQTDGENIKLEAAVDGGYCRVTYWEEKAWLNIYLTALARGSGAASGCAQVPGGAPDFLDDGRPGTLYYRVPAVHGGVRWQEQRREGTQRVLRGVVPRVL